MASLPLLARLIARPVRALSDQVSAALEGEEQGVHQARVASRRLRELLPIVGGVLERGPRRRLRRRLRSLTRALGPVRELDVMLAAIDRMTEAVPTPSVAIAELKRTLITERAARLAALRHRFDPARVERLHARLTRLESRLVIGPEPDGWRATLADRIARRALALNAAVADAGALFVSERLHGVRIAVKKLRYALEVAGDARLAGTGRLVRTLKDAQDALGKLHDDDVLLDGLRRLTVSSAASAGVSDEVARFDRELTADTRRLHARYLHRQALLVRVADRALEQVAPRIEAGAEARVRRARPRAARP